MDSSLASSAATASGDPSPLLWAALPVAAYLVGSFPTAHLLARSRGVDLGAVGSKNYGATNLGRTLGRSWGILCFMIDATKGALPVVLGGWLLGALGAPSGGVTTATAWCWLATALAAILGHTLSPWIGFKGGKGVATGFGALVAMWPVLTLPAGLAILLWAAILAVSRIISLASMVAAISIPCSVLVAALAANGLAGVRAAVPFLVATGVIAAFVVWKHRSNIARMRAGTEPKVGAKKPAGDGAASPETK
ncbi:MAG: glycerol-3-phosphate 1-O-acyltransferase PlsY [Planctomycetota bacterium]|nr:glycerol-3-phosphate 1-O-acyltransferase PlsY [Planctomycetota bacterium]